MLGKNNAAKIICPIIGGFVTGFIFAAGKVLDSTDSINLRDVSMYVKWLVIMAATSLIYYFLFMGIDYLRDRISKNTRSKEDTSSKNVVGVPILLGMIIVLLAWIPTWLSIFPGAFNYDAYDEWQMVANGKITAHHPVLHVLALGGLTNFADKMWGNANIGIAIYTAVQMVLLAFIFALTLKKLKEFGCGIVSQILLVLFYAFCPVIQLFAVASTKDTIFCGVELIFFLEVTSLLSSDDYLTQTKSVITLGIVSFLTMILRNNGPYIVIVTLLVCIIVNAKKWKQCFKQIALLLLITFIPYMVFIGPIYKACGIEKAKVQEMLSVPMQQMARVYAFEKEELEQQDIDLLHEFFREENLQNYHATVSDLVKMGFIDEGYEENKAAFYKLWIKWGKKYPLVYVSSFLINTVDGWYPGAVIDGYRFSDGKSSYFDYKVATPGRLDSKIEWLNKKWDYISNDVKSQRGILFILFFSPGTYLLCFGILWLYAISRRLFAVSIAGISQLIHYATVLVGPIALVRYELDFFYLFPVIWLLIFYSKNSDEEKSR